jgi:hypothetical protein
MNTIHITSLRERRSLARWETGSRCQSGGAETPTTRKEKDMAKRIVRYLATMGTALTLTASPALAAERADSAGAPVKLTDQELDQVTAGEGSLLDLNLNLNVLLKNIAVTVNVSNVPINAAFAVQANALGTAAQTATIQAFQGVTQMQAFPSFP